MRGLIGGMLTGGLVSVVGLGALSVVGEPPAGIIPPEQPMVDAPLVDQTSVDVPDDTDTESTSAGNIVVDDPQSPEVPDSETVLQDAPVTDFIDLDASILVENDAQAPSADSDPLDEPVVSEIEAELQIPITPGGVNIIAEPVDPILPNPQSIVPEIPEDEANLNVSTTPAEPIIVEDSEVELVIVDEVPVDAIIAEVTPDPVAEPVVVDIIEDAIAAVPEAEITDLTPNNTDVIAPELPSSQPLVQLGGENSLLSDRDTGVTIRRPTTQADEPVIEEVASAADALTRYAADAGDVGLRSMMSFVLIDDGSMSDGRAALAGLPFRVTIALDPSLPNAAALMDSYRSNGFEVVVMTKLPEGALPSDVEITFESVFTNFSETVGVLDLGSGGLQTDTDVTAQAMGIFAEQGRGFISVGQGLNMANRAANEAGVPSVVVSRDLDNEGQDASVVRRFVDRAAFQARQEGGVVLVGRVRPETISALMSWGTANLDDQVAIVPVSAVLLAQ